MKRIDRYFNPPGSWMDRIDPDLLLRYWYRKGCPGAFRVRRFGLIVERISTPWGQRVAVVGPLPGGPQ